MFSSEKDNDYDNGFALAKCNEYPRALRWDSSLLVLVVRLDDDADSLCSQKLQLCSGFYCVISWFL